ncbi:DUF305 domain-containing protein, partial [Actinoplanes sp. NPDC051411]|uniref:DUF305 domain-containing protein n=1 Tax=Actinoplanes sp. NPDC051411 TaxID=3155522 RepID=UPI0034243E9A
CSPEQPATSPPSSAFGPTDVMFAQMALAQDHDGSQVAALASTRSSDPRIRTIASSLRDRFAADSGTLSRWLLGWQQPLTAPPGAHAGHGDLHALQPADLASLRAASGAVFDRTAVALLLGGLHNSVETTRMESTGGDYPPARQLATSMTSAYQEQIRALLVIAAAQ